MATNIKWQNRDGEISIDEQVHDTVAYVDIIEGIGGTVIYIEAAQ